jgi:hypothetical protein
MWGGMEHEAQVTSLSLCFFSFLREAMNEWAGRRDGGADKPMCSRLLRIGILKQAEQKCVGEGKDGMGWRA